MFNKHVFIVAAIWLFLPFAAYAQLVDFLDSDQGVQSKIGHGKWAVVMIWSHECHVCNQEAHAYQNFHLFHEDKDAIMIGISMDGEENIEQANRFIAKHEITFANFIGEPQQVALYYQMMTSNQFRGTPTFMVFDPQGELRAEQAGAVPVTSIERFISTNSTTK